MYQLSRSSGNAKYSKAADDYLRYALKTCLKGNGVGFLLLALLELDQPDKKSPGAF
jgi:hypothetical protein